MNLFGLSFFLGILSGSAQEVTLTAEEKEEGFELIFDGSSLSGWEQKGNWVVEDGAMSRTKKGGDITYKTRKIPDNFELRFEWKISPGGNSGLYYRPGQYEYQILDNQKHSNGKDPRTTAAALYFCMAPSHDATKPVGEWNTGRIVCKGTVIQHWLNGLKVVHFDYTDPQWKGPVDRLQRVRGADLKDRGANLKLQDHGDSVWYRAIKLRSLTEDVKLDATRVVPQTIPAELLAKDKK
jgi:hypothetical protein